MSEPLHEDALSYMGGAASDYSEVEGDHPGDTTDKLRNTKKSVTKWTQAEDEMIMMLVKEHGIRKWSVIGAFLPGRNGKVRSILISPLCPTTNTLSFPSSMTAMSRAVAQPVGSEHFKASLERSRGRDSS